MIDFGDVIVEVHPERILSSMSFSLELEFKTTACEYNGTGLLVPSHRDLCRFTYKQWSDFK